MWILKIAKYDKFFISVFLNKKVAVDRVAWGLGMFSESIVPALYHI